MGIFQRLRAAVARSPTAAQVKMVTETGNGLYVYDGNLYKSDIVRACIRPKIKAVGKATPRHIRTTIGPDGKTNTQTNPDPYIRLLLEEPNQYMTWQMYAEKMETQLILNNNAFALIQRDDNGFPVALFPIVASADGDYRALHRAGDRLDIACDALANAYMRKTGKTRDEIRAMMDAETWVDARRAVELGLVDEVMGGELVAADAPGLLPESVVQKTLAMFRDQNAAALAQAKTDYENLIKKGVV